MQRGRLRAAFGVAGVTALLIAGVAFAESGDRGDPKRSAQGTIPVAEHLRAMLSAIENGAAADSPRELKQAWKAALDRKRQAAQAMFFYRYAPTGESLFRCDSTDSDGVLVSLEHVDVQLEIAAKLFGKVKTYYIAQAAVASGGVGAILHGCPGADHGPRKRAKEIDRRAHSIFRQRDAHELTASELKKGIDGLAQTKERLLEGQRIYDCEASEVYALIKAIGLPLTYVEGSYDRAPVRGVSGYRLDFQRRKRYIGQARRPAQQLIEMWGRCGIQMCADEADNDADGLVDGNDLGCRSGPDGAYDPADRGEQDDEVELDCPSYQDGVLMNRSAVTSYQAEGSSVIRHSLRNTTTDRVVFERAEGAPDFDAGSVALGAEVCGPGTDASLDWLVDREQMAVAYSIRFNTGYVNEGGGVRPDYHLFQAVDSR